MRLAILSVLMFFFNSAYANAVIGMVEQSTGIVKVKGVNSFKKKSVKSGYKIKEGDLLSTLKDAKAVLKLIDGSNIILSDSSSINFKSLSNAKQISGKIYYKITSRDAKNSLKVKTPFAIIGIKGTTFVVNSNKGKESVALKEGLIGISSIKEEFSLYRKNVLAAYKNYLSNQMSEFEKFKHPQEAPKPEMTKDFDLKEGNVVSFSKNIVKESGWNKDDDAEFDEFEKLIDLKFKDEKSKSSSINDEIKENMKF